MGLLDAFFGGKSDDSAAREMQAEEARKAALRKRVDAFYGIDSEPDPVPHSDSGFFKNWVNSLGDQAAAGNAARSSQAGQARTAMEAENAKLGDATRGYYTDALNRDYTKAERNTRFALARQGLAGGSADIDANRELQTDQNLGSTRISEAVARSVNDLINQREQERLNAYNLIAGGAGESAVNSAVAGLKRSFDNVSNQQRADLFGDLFDTGLNAGASSNQANQQAMLAQRYRDRLNTFFSPTSSTSGRVTASG